MVNSDRILRYEAVPENKVTEDAHRKFIVGVFLADDTVACWEVKQRNSGCVEGKFMERSTASMPHINPKTGEKYRPGDFYVGAYVVVRSMLMRIVRADEYTLKYMATDPDEYPQSSVARVAQKIAGLSLGDVASLGPEDFRDAVAGQLGVELTDQELITVLRACNVPDTAEIDLRALQGVINDQPLSAVVGGS
jgi:hypothetical protein